MDKELFSERLKSLRKEKGYSNPKQFADAYNEKFPPKRRDEASGNITSGILGTIKHYENPNYTKSMPTLDKVMNMCELLDCDIDYLTGKLDYKTHSIKFICEFTGLSEEAVELLHYLQGTTFHEEKRTLSFLNLILSDPKNKNRMKSNALPVDTILSLMDQYVTSGEVKRAVHEDQTLPESLEEFKAKEAMRHIDERTVIINSSDDTTEIVGITELYKEYKWQQIRRTLEKYHDDYQTRKQEAE